MQSKDKNKITILYAAEQRPSEYTMVQLNARWAMELPAYLFVRGAPVLEQ